MADEMEKSLATKMNRAARKNPAVMSRVYQRRLSGAISAGDTRAVTRMMTKVPKGLKSTGTGGGSPANGPSQSQIRANQREAQQRRQNLKNTIGPKAATRKYGRDYGS